MRILAVNAGSGSLHLTYVANDVVGDRLDLAHPPGSGEARRAVQDFLAGHDRPEAVGHRLVHGGGLVRQPAVVDDRLRAALNQVADLAPLHVPPALDVLDQMREQLPGVPHVLCPDTAFHADLPDVAATYALPAEWRAKWGLRRYGFHGLSYAWATQRSAQLLDRPVAALQLVLAHLGGGASVCAVRGGRSVDTSMGFTPLEGSPMSKRSGSIDPGMLLWLLGDSRLSLDELTDGLYRRSGLLGLSNGRSADTRDLVAARADGNRDAAFALDVFVYRVRREIAAAAASLDRLDALVFTGEIGWNQPEVRHAVCAGLGPLGLTPPALVDVTQDGVISAAGALPVLVVRSREELQLALDVRRAVSHPATYASTYRPE